jgi:hypothetical protein
MSPELEDRLRAALQARAAQVTSDKLRPGSMPKARQQRTGRWLAPALLAAAAGIAGLIAGSVLIHPRLSSGPLVPAVTPPAVTTPATISPTTPPPASKRPSPSTTPPPTEVVDGGHGRSTANPPPAPTLQTFDGVRLPVPAGWRLTTVRDGLARVGCLLPPSADQPADKQGCALAVQLVQQSPNGAQIIDPNAAGGLRDRVTDFCPGDGFKDVKGGERRAVTVDGRTGEYRTIVADCALNDYVIRQWVFADRPGVVLVRWRGGGTYDAEVASVVAGAQLPAGSGVPMTDFGRVVGSRQTATGLTLTFDRVTHGSLWTGPELNDNPRTYDLPVGNVDDVVVLSATTICGPSTVTTTDAGGLGTSRCTLAAMLQALTDNAQSVAGASIWVQYNADGTVGALVQEYRP